MVREARREDLEIVANLAALLWTEQAVPALVREFDEYLSEGKTQFFLKYEQDMPVGFAQCQLRYEYVEGTDTKPVGYLEGIFVQQAHRNQGYGKELLAACEAWAKTHGCREFASDCVLDNAVSFRFHKAAQFTEANRIICFVKRL